MIFTKVCICKSLSEAEVGCIKVVAIHIVGVWNSYCERGHQIDSRWSLLSEIIIEAKNWSVELVKQKWLSNPKIGH